MTGTPTERGGKNAADSPEPGRMDGEPGSSATTVQEGSTESADEEKSTESAGERRSNPEREDPGVVPWTETVVEGLPKTNRRTFVTTSGLLASLGAAGFAGRGGRERPGVADLVLTKADLLAPDGVGYAEWSVRPDRSPLISYCTNRVPGLADLEIATSGFRADDDAHVPGYVESAAIELAHVSTATAIADVTSNWLAAHHGRAAVVDRIDVRRGGRARRWTVALGDEVDLLRTHRIGDRLLFTAVRGVRDATLSPDRALSYYSRVQRLRAIGTQG